jgi:hypothetical protein
MSCKARMNSARCSGNFSAKTRLTLGYSHLHTAQESHSALENRDFEFLS